jgi:hypothetical protein
MTIYNHTVSFQDIERFEIESLVEDAIKQFKAAHPDGSHSVPWVWESILHKLKNAQMSLLSSNNFAEGGNTIFIHSDKP